MKNKVQSITEAFAMQPNYFAIKDIKMGMAAFEIHTENDIEKIELEVMNETTNVYVGYNFEGKKMFEYIASAVNVHYI